MVSEPIGGVCVGEVHEGNFEVFEEQFGYEGAALDAPVAEDDEVFGK